MDRLLALTSLRFLPAALSIVAYHFGMLPDGAYGWAGVSMFFILSGFVLTYAHQHNSQPIGKWLAFRALRLFPLHWLMLAVMLLLEGPVPHLWAHVALLQSWLPDGYIPANKPAWSISDELFFYATFPALVRLPWRGLMTAAIAGLAAIGNDAAYVDHAGLLNPPGFSWWWLFYVLPVTRLPEFMLGMALAGFMAERGLARREAWLALTVGVAGLLVTLFAPWGPYVARVTPFVLPFALVIVGTAALLGAFRWLESRPLVLLGESSFALYMINWPIHYVAVAGGWWVKIGLIVATVALSVVVHLWVEMPIQRAGRRWINRTWRTA